MLTCSSRSRNRILTFFSAAADAAAVFAANAFAASSACCFSLATFSARAAFSASDGPTATKALNADHQKEKKTI